MSKNKKNHLYVFVKGRKGKGAFEITDSDYEPQHIEPVEIEGESELPPSTMDLKAIEKSLEYIKEHRGSDRVPKEPVISIFTTYENNYHVASGLKKPQTPDRIQFKQALEKLQEDFARPGQGQHDEIKCYWIPDDFENCIEDVKKLLNKRRIK